MEKRNFRLIICDMPDKEELVCQVFYKNEQWIEISAEVPHEFVIAFCNKEGGDYWEFSYDEAMKIIQEAKRRLEEKQRTPEQQKRYDEQIRELENFNPTPEQTAEYERKMEEQRKKYYG